jgi:hypothetical protein
MFQFDSHILITKMDATGNLRLQKHAWIENKQGGSCNKDYLNATRQLKCWSGQLKGAEFSSMLG